MIDSFFANIFEKQKESSTAIDKMIKGAAAKGLCIVAIGGYGREQLAPFSDIDLCIIMKSEGKADLKSAQKLIDTLWTTPHKPSPIIGTPQECFDAVRSDMTRFSAFLDMRHITGDKALFTELKKHISKHINDRSPLPFIKAKLAERDANHAGHGESRFCVEPNIKSGKGGLRDIHALHWVLRRLNHTHSFEGLFTSDLLSQDEQTGLKNAYQFFTSLRIALHDFHGRANETLTFNAQLGIAEQIDSTLDQEALQELSARIMQRYFEHAQDVGHITRTICAYLESEFQGERITHAFTRAHHDIPAPFFVDGYRLSAADDADIHDIALGAFEILQSNDIALHPALIRRITSAVQGKSLQDAWIKSARTTLIDWLCGPLPERTLRLAHEMGLLGLIIPDFKRLTGLIQYDGYHRYTADEHSLTAIGKMLEVISNGTPSVSQNRILMTALFFHDIGKGLGGDHEEKGAEVFLTYAKDLGFDDKDAQDIAYLIRTSGRIFDFAFKRDLYDPGTLKEFCTLVPSIRELKYIAALGIADSMAVAPDFWTPWKHETFMQLYEAARRYIAKGERPEDTHTHPDTPLSFETLEDMNVTRVHIVTKDRRALFRDICGAIAAADARVLTARIRTYDDKTVYDRFDIQTPNEQPLDHLDHITRHLNDVINGSSLDSTESRATQSSPFKDSPRISFDTNISPTSTVMELDCQDRAGLLYIVANTLSDIEVQITSAQVNTFAGRALDIFYIRDRFGLPITDRRFLSHIRKKILQNLA